MALGPRTAGDPEALAPALRAAVSKRRCDARAGSDSVSRDVPGRVAGAANVSDDADVGARARRPDARSYWHRRRHGAHHRGADAGVWRPSRARVRRAPTSGATSCSSNCGSRCLGPTHRPRARRMVASRLLASMLPEAARFDAAVATAAVALLAATATAAAAVPASRVLRLNPGFSAPLIQAPGGHCRPPGYRYALLAPRLKCTVQLRSGGHDEKNPAVASFQQPWWPQPL